jgi:hypothetical protein
VIRDIAAALALLMIVATICALALHVAGVI